MCTRTYTRVHTHVYATVCKWKSGQLLGAGTLLPPDGSQGSASGCLVWWQALGCLLVFFSPVEVMLILSVGSRITRSCLPLEEMDSGGGFGLITVSLS